MCSRYLETPADECNCKSNKLRLYVWWLMFARINALVNPLVRQ